METKTNRCLKLSSFFVILGIVVILFWITIGVTVAFEDERGTQDQVPTYSNQLTQNHSSTPVQIQVGDNTFMPEVESNVQTSVYLDNFDDVDNSTQQLLLNEHYQEEISDQSLSEVPDKPKEPSAIDKFLRKELISPEEMAQIIKELVIGDNGSETNKEFAGIEERIQVIQNFNLTQRLIDPEMIKDIVSSNITAEVTPPKTPICVPRVFGYSLEQARDVYKAKGTLRDCADDLPVPLICVSQDPDDPESTIASITCPSSGTDQPKSRKAIVVGPEPHAERLGSFVSKAERRYENVDSLPMYKSEYAFASCGEKLNDAVYINKPR